MMPKKSGLTEEEKQQAAWLKKNTRLDASRELVRRTLNSAALSRGADVVIEYELSSWGHIYGLVKGMVADYHSLKTLERWRLVPMAALMASKAENRGTVADVEAILHAAWGFYVKVEPQKQDAWRDHPFEDLVKHAQHEVEEIGRGDTLERRLHNGIDLVALLAMLYARSEQ